VEKYDIPLGTEGELKSLFNSPSVPSGISYFSTLQFSFCSQWNIIFLHSSILLLFPVEYHISPLFNSPSVPIGISYFSTLQFSFCSQWNIIFLHSSILLLFPLEYHISIEEWRNMIFHWEQKEN
jgi:hypothetical protein